MKHDQEIASIISQVTPWPEEERVALAYQILRDMRFQVRAPAPRRTLERAQGLARGTTPAPDDVTVQKWIEEHRTSKYG